MATKLLVLAALVVLAGCETTPKRCADPITVYAPGETVKVPVIERAKVPARLFERIPAGAEALPVWTRPDDPAASSALTEREEVKLRMLLILYQTRVEELQAAVEKAE